MSKARPFSIHLSQDEAAELLLPSGSGGHQTLHENLIGQLANGNLQIILDDEDLGKLIRYMTQYGSGGFQSRLRKAFKRPLIDLLS
jgi:hypothetical protein